MSAAQDARRAHERALTGDLRGVAAAEVAARDADLHGWALALAFARWHVAPTDRIPTLAADLASGPEAKPTRWEGAPAGFTPAGGGGGAPSGGSDDADGLVAAAVHSARIGVFQDQPSRIDAALSVANRVPACTASAEAGRALLGAWSALASNDLARARALGELAERTAHDAGLSESVQAAAWVIEAAAVRALVEEAGGDPAGALKIARRAFRMSMAERFPQAQYLAGLVLARMRRVAGSPPLALRILGSIRAVAPRSWWAWLDYELLLAGHPPGAASVGDALGDPAVDSLARMLEAAERGDAAGFDAASDRTASAISARGLRARELDVTWRALDPRRVENHHPDDLTDWRLGKTSRVPARVSGVCQRRDETGIRAWVVVAPATRSVRIAGVAAPLARALYGADFAERKPRRTDAVLASLALAAEAGVDRDTLFLSAYGFRYDHIVHRGVFKSQIHRMRRWLGDRGAIEQDEREVFRLRVARPFLVPDARCTQPLEEVMLGYLARHPRVSAKDCATAVMVPLRTAQAALHQLVADGAVEAVRVGRAVEYRLEDTTFSEPTGWGQ